MVNLAEAVDRYAVMGNPVAHSRSPFIHQSFAHQCGHKLSYERLLSPLDGFERQVRQFVAAGGRGCNVTTPFKFEALKLAQKATARARRAGAANVLSFDGEYWLADNSDGAGLVRDIEEGVGLPLAGLSILLIGAGGAAAGVLGPLLEQRPARLVICNRSPEKAVALAHSHAEWAREHGTALLATSLGQAPAAAQGPGYDLVINASASSLHEQASPVAGGVLRPGSLALDLMYGPAAEPWLDWARSHGAQVRDGLGMLVEQAALAFALWRGVEPQTAPVLRALRAALQDGH